MKILSGSLLNRAWKSFETHTPLIMWMTMEGLTIWMLKVFLPCVMIFL